ncbi:MAG: DEAD/DEAH box helicase, partial [Chlorobi bacterium]|nr:DEAD/DEAH box helicase [Chlorobiota bacterium]
MKSFLTIFDRPEYEASLSLGKGSRVLISGLAGGMKGQFAARLLRDTQRQVIALAASPVEARELWTDASSVLGEEDVVYVGSEHPHVVKSLEALDSAFVENVENLRRLLGSPGKLVIMPQEMLLSHVPSPDELLNRTITVNTGDSLDMTGLVHRLDRGGYDRKEFVETTGDYAVRGGILDVFPAGFENPVRIEFFGDSVDSIREFDALSQRSIRNLGSVSFMDALYLQEEDRDSTAGRVPDFFHPDAVLFIEEAARFKELLDESDERERLEEMRSLFPVFEHSILPHDGGPVIDFGGELQPAFNGSVKFLREDLRNKLSEGWSLTIVADSKPQATRMRDLLFGEDEPDAELAGVRITTALFSRGFMVPDLKIACYTEHDIFNRKHVQKRTHRGFKGLSLREMRQLKPGDYVVHVDKGVGKFLGFETISVGGGKQETIKIAFDGGDMLYVNLNYINRISKYSGQEGKEPKLSKLGSAEWARLKARTKKRLKDIARDLIALYAKRKLARGFPFPPDNEWQKELEASFIYEDTPDQAQATREVKVDMESPVPMDRLICGDVGFGKTEVAVRAAFKAVMAGKQVAILVPTTILAQQHYHTFNDRLHRYAIQVESLSRFRSPKRTREILDGLSRGTVDIVIGTHRMLSRDVEFKNLGLLVIDEEHRFGVAAK